ncbi:MAG: UDP-N-acetylmuramate dehydrogenase [Bacteroidetes bacterium]|nr:UDP-N-acetylmuramate dehydrogenase [Bacteroidota bacterium]
MNLQRNFPLKNLNTFGIEAYANFFIELNNSDQIIEFLENSEYRNQPLLILGGGSNLLFANDFEGIVLKINNKGIVVVSEDEDFVIVKAFAGEVWLEFVDYCVEKNWGGIENLALIPGNVGSCPVQNIGAYGVEVKDTLFEIDAFRISDGQKRTFKNSECNFGYRNSIFKQELKNQYIIEAVSFKLRKKPILNRTYQALEREIQILGIENPTIKDLSEIICKIRREKLPDPEEIGNAGSFFKNPTINSENFKKLISEFPNIAYFKQSDGSFKLAAAWLIEQCRWKGSRFGDAGVHKNQALVLVNYGNAKGTEIVELAKNIQKSVLENFRVHIEMEVNIV